jgi:CheY-like chemotaxis protein/DNA-binding MarR family transcriptional regulator
MKLAVDFAADGVLPRCKVLIVDEDERSRDEYCRNAERLGYEAECVETAAEALQRLAQDHSIGIVAFDLEMGIGGLAFLDELSSRFSLLRPVVPIVVSGSNSLESAVEAMRFNARDFLTRPVSPDAFAGALRRATRAWQDLYAGFRLVAAARREVRAAPPEEERAAAPGEDPEVMLAQVRSLMRMREKRAGFFDPDLFSDPNWDILLDLTAARLEGKAIPVSSACAATNVPLSTALRYVRGLVDAGMVRRWKDTEDRRRDMLELDDRTMEAMTRYLMDVRRHSPVAV